MYNSCSNMCNRYNGSGNSEFQNYSRTVYNPNGYGNVNYATSYVRNQRLGSVFSPSEGLANGTMFPELVMPYYPGQSLNEMNFLRYNNGGGCCR